MMHGSDHVTDAEMLARKILAKQKSGATQAEIEALRKISRDVAEELSNSAWEKCFISLARSLNILTRTLSLSNSMTREKSTQTQPVLDMLPLSTKKKREVSPHEEVSQSERNPLRSAAPRARGPKLDLPKNILQHVDNILERYVAKEGITLPSNFRRIDPAGNTFQFGTKKIELMPVDRFVAVKVGGGYLLFDEFCEKHSQAEQRRSSFERAENHLHLLALKSLHIVIAPV
jgi:hypothetical protein